jgi:hypothetical protein
LHKYDGQVIFTAALFLLTNEAIEKYILSKRNDASKSIIQIGKISEDGQENQSSSQ